MPEPRKRGRPLGSGGGVRFPHRITVPLSDEQFAQLQHAVDSSSDTAADVLRAGLDLELTRRAQEDADDLTADYRGLAERHRKRIAQDGGPTIG